MPDPRILPDSENMIVSTRPCAFYQAALLAQTDAGRSSLHHRCILNPGKSVGPDEGELSPTACTVERQAACQTHRRQAFARLHATLPSLRDNEAPEQAAS